MRIAVFLLIVGLASGCGQRGELYLRDGALPAAQADAGKSVPDTTPAAERSEKKR